MAQRSVGVTLSMQWLCHIGRYFGTLRSSDSDTLPSTRSAGYPAGHAATHGIERDLVNADGTGEGAGYFRPPCTKGKIKHAKVFRA
jgi:hypothetical protein